MKQQVVRLTRVNNIAAGLLLSLAMGSGLFAQQGPTEGRTVHRRYSFVDLGTLGGPAS